MKRYEEHPDGGMREDELGAYVKYDDATANLSDKQIVDLAWEHLGEPIFTYLTREKSEPMIPQETYDVPRLSLRQFVDAVRCKSKDETR